MQSALFKSKLFAEFSMSDLPDTVELSRRMMISVPASFPETTWYDAIIAEADAR